MAKYQHTFRIAALLVIAAVLTHLVMSRTHARANRGAPAPATRPTASTRPTDDPAALELPSADGGTMHPLAVDGAKGVVLLFISTDCPISNSYAPELNRFCAHYGIESPGDRSGLRFYFVHVDPALKPAEAKAHAHDYGYTCPILLDGHRKLAARFGVKVTPEAVVLDASGKLAYRGRIDDKYVAYGRARPEATTHELRDALEAVRAGKTPAVTQADAVGCPIE